MNLRQFKKNRKTMIKQTKINFRNTLDEQTQEDVQSIF
jgi:hypothetical protein